MIRKGGLSASSRSNQLGSGIVTQRLSRTTSPTILVKDSAPIKSNTTAAVSFSNRAKRLVPRAEGVPLDSAATITVAGASEVEIQAILIANAVTIDLFTINPIYEHI